MREFFVPSTPSGTSPVLSALTHQYLISILIGFGAAEPQAPTRWAPIARTDGGSVNGGSEGSTMQYDPLDCTKRVTIRLVKFHRNCKEVMQCKSRRVVMRPQKLSLLPLFSEAQ